VSSLPDTALFVVRPISRQAPRLTLLPANTSIRQTARAGGTGRRQPANRRTSWSNLGSRHPQPAI